MAWVPYGFSITGTKWENYVGQKYGQGEDGVFNAHKLKKGQIVRVPYSLSSTSEI